MNTTVVRGCGTRSPGAVYCECLLGPDGMPIEHFLVDPPNVIDKDALGLTPKGVRLIQVGGVYHILDWVGGKHYPNVADMVEEIRRFGMSRRLSRKLDFHKLTLKSRILLLHGRAHVENWKKYKSEAECPKYIDGHDDKPSQQMCVKTWWEDVDGGVPDDSLFDARQVRRVMPSFDYAARRRPDGVQPKYKLAVFASLPIHRLAVINDPTDQAHLEAQKAVAASEIPSRLLDG